MAGTVTNYMISRAGALISADTVTINQSPRCKVIPFINNYSPDSSIAVTGGMTQSTDTGLAAVLCTANPNLFVDAVTGEQVIRLAGDFTFEANGDGDAFPITVYGYAVTDNNLVHVLKWERFDVPVELTAAGQAVDVGGANFPQPEIRMPLNTLE